MRVQGLGLDPKPHTKGPPFTTPPKSNHAFGTVRVDTRASEIERERERERERECVCV